MGDEPVIDATVIEEPPAVGREVVTRARTTLAVTPDIKAGELVERLAIIREAMDNAMVEDIDYGKVPGTNKPTLLKPGAEKLGVLFQLDVQIENEQAWGPGDHLTVTARAIAYHAPTGARLGYGEGLCTTRERKYAYRKGERVCPDCGKPAVIKGKAEYGGGWLCFEKKGGCKHKWADDSEQGKAFASQDVGETENPDLPDLWNTVTKMAEKRARVDAVLAVTGASALFTQDAEDRAAPAEQPTTQQGPVYGPAANDGVLAQTRAAIGYVLQADELDVDGVLSKIAATTSTEADRTYMPYIACRAVCLLASRVKELQEPVAVPGEGDPAEESSEEKEERERAERLAEASA